MYLVRIRYHRYHLVVETLLHIAVELAMETVALVVVALVYVAHLMDST